ncbi:ribosome assembly cofactor RimP [Synechococcus sp. CCY 9618]|uniref:ribosome assembly cofactor RimP n=1 Tax=Synechococcus sp. CCY 9618 TaxID=2815602 RepID=UPI001C217822|nr:ribosome assembly cofactor RimP [Synechococcus sp. CCY 9618]
MPHPLTDNLEQLARPVARAAHLEVRSVEVLAHRIPLTVVVRVQRADGTDVHLDECAAVSGPLAEALEASGLLTMAYVLEVSSPGIGEDLLSDREFTSFRGFPVEVLLRRADGAETSHRGHLLSRDEQVVQLNARGRILRLPRGEVLRVRLTEAPSDS